MDDRVAKLDLDALPDYWDFYRRVLRGEIPGTPKAIFNMALREAEDYLVRQHDPGFSFYFDGENALRALAYYRRFPFPDDEKAGLPWDLEPWQQAFLTSMGSWKVKRRPSHRRYQRVLLMVGRKSGKTALAALVAVVRLITAPRGQGELYSIATKKDQSGLSLRAAAKMLRHMGNNHPLTRRVRIMVDGIYHKKIDRRGNEEIRHWKNLSRDARGAEGLAATVCVLDEAAAVENTELVNSLWHSMRGRASPLMLCVTTAQPVFKSKFMTWKMVLEDGFEKPEKADQRMFGFLFSADRLPRETDDELFERLRTHPETWKGMLPNLGVSHHQDMVERDFRDGELNPYERADMLLKTFCVFTGSGDDKFIEPAIWDESPQDVVKEGRVFFGVDIGLTSDFSSVCVLWDNGAGYFSAEVKCFVPEAGYDSANSELKPIYQAAINAGELEICGDAVLDFPAFTESLISLCRAYRPQMVGIDPYRAQEVIESTMKAGFECGRIYQGYKLSEPIGRLERLILAGRLRMAPNKLMRWMAANTRRKIKGQQVALYKPNEAFKIDGVMALLYAVHVSSQGNTKVSTFREVTEEEYNEDGTRREDAPDPGDASEAEREAEEAARLELEEQDEFADPFDAAYRDMMGG